jgi:MFS family permease
MHRSPGLRWWIAGLIFLATLINFVNRLTISVLAPVITEQLHLSASEFASLTNSFLLAYTISQALSGRLYDRIGNRRGFSVSIMVWSVASMLHAFATGLFSLNCLRFLLGLGEAGNWPGAAKVIAEWFPVRQRALGMAIFNSGTSIGRVIAPPLIIGMEVRFGWQATFLVAGGMGFVWLILWLATYHPPDQHPRITPEELALIRADRDTGAKSRPGWGELLRYRQTWAIVLSALLYRPRVVALHHLAAAVPVPSARLQSETDRPVRVAALRGGGCRQSLRRVGIRSPDRAWMEREPRAQEHRPARDAVHVRGSVRGGRAHCVRGAGGDRGGAVRLSDLDQQCPDHAQRLVSG